MEASISGSLSVSTPPACAKSGRPPPLPPTCSAANFTKSPALILLVKGLDTPAHKAILLLFTAASNTTALSDLPVKSVTMSRKAAASVSICATTKLAVPMVCALSNNFAPA